MVIPEEVVMEEVVEEQLSQQQFRAVREVQEVQMVVEAEAAELV
jgi:hypothetical protein